MDITPSQVVAIDVADVGAGDQVGPFRLLRMIGEGATGRVFEVEHTVIGRRAALKVLSADHAVRPSAIRRLFAEAQAVNRINHPHIVEIIDIVEPGPAGARASIVMELLEGCSLAQLIASGQPLGLGRVVFILIQVADALGAAHAAGFAHRDLKPENIFLTERDGVRDYVKLLDFGLAKSLMVEGGAGANANLNPNRTLEGTFLGTPAYASPEQASGKPVDHRTDIYAFGVILYQLLCGQLPFRGENLGDYLVQHITVPPPPVPEIFLASPLGAALSDIASKCLNKDPAHRYVCAEDLKQDLESLPGAPTTAPARLTGPWWQRETTWWKSRRARIGLGIGAAVVAFGLAAAVRLALTPASPAPATRPAQPSEVVRAEATSAVISPPLVPTESGRPVDSGKVPRLDGPPRKTASPPARRPSRQRSHPMRERTLDPFRR